jgi:hypothetical protein
MSSLQRGPVINSTIAGLVISLQLVILSITPPPASTEIISIQQHSISADGRVPSSVMRHARNEASNPEAQNEQSRTNCC